MIVVIEEERKKRYSLFWDVMQRLLAAIHRHFGTDNRPLIQGSSQTT